MSEYSLESDSSDIRSGKGRERRGEEEIWKRRRRSSRNSRPYHSEDNILEKGVKRDGERFGRKERWARGRSERKEVKEKLNHDEEVKGGKEDAEKCVGKKKDEKEDAEKCVGKKKDEKGKHYHHHRHHRVYHHRHSNNNNNGRREPCKGSKGGGSDDKVLLSDNATSISRLLGPDQAFLSLNLNGGPDPESSPDPSLSHEWVIGPDPSTHFTSQSAIHPNHGPGEVDRSGQGNEDTGPAAGDSCPFCRQGHFQKKFTWTGVIASIILFPCGIYCCFKSRALVCTNCGASPI